MIRFWELMRCAGVDEDATPFPGMVVPFPGSNIVVLDTDGRDLKVAPNPNNGSIELEEFDATDLRKQLIETSIELSQPGVDSQYKESMMPTSLFWYTKPRFFRIRGRKHKIDLPGVQVQAKAGNKVEATLQVVVLDTMVVKVAIRNLKVRNGQGMPTYHAATPVDAGEKCNGMNAVWIPQTNVVFELVRSEPAFIDDHDAATRATLAKGFGLKDAETASVPPVIDPLRMEEVFLKHMVPGTQITFFLVDKLKDGANGQMLPTGIGFVKSNHGPTTFAHEAGHYLGGSVVGGQWKNHGHTYDRPREKDIRMLMRDGGAGWKIPFELVKQFRGFFDRHPVH
jgi:hypothetical protein